MTPSCAIDSATLTAYQQTEYRVLGSFPAVLQVGVRCADLAVLHRAHATACSAFITACNPLGVMAGDAANARRQQDLLQQILAAGLVAIPGIGQHPTGSWPGEPSYLVPGLARAAALELGRRFAQNAIIWAGDDAVPELILLK